MDLREADQDYYAILQVHEKAIPEVIDRAYRVLARKYHPDVSKEKDAETRFNTSRQFP